jgi:hypothetical protein
MATYSLDEIYGGENNPAYFKGSKTKRPVELVVYPDGTARYEYVSSEVTPNSGAQLDKADEREVEIAKADERVHNQFDSKSWRDFLLTQAAGAAVAGAGAVAMPYIGNGILAGGDKAAGYLLSKMSTNPTAAALLKTGLKSYFGVEGLRNYFSDNGWAKTVREWNTYNNKFGAIKSGLGDVMDLSMVTPSLKTISFTQHYPKSFISKFNNWFYKDVPIPTTNILRRKAGKFEVGQPISLLDIIKDKNTIDFIKKFNLDVSPRLRWSLSDEGTLIPPMTKPLVNDYTKDVNYFISTPVDDNTLAFSNNRGNIGIPINRLHANKIPDDEIIIHELEHSQRKKIKDELPSSIFGNRAENVLIKQKDKRIEKQALTLPRYTAKEAKLLDDAYIFSEDYLNTHDISPLLEKGATNRQIRYRILKYNNQVIGTELDNIIDNLSDKEIIDYVKNSNAYGEDIFMNFLNKNEKVKGGRNVDSNVVKSQADKIRKALKYVAYNYNTKTIDSNYNYT